MNSLVIFSSPDTITADMIDDAIANIEWEVSNLVFSGSRTWPVVLRDLPLEIGVEKFNRLLVANWVDTRRIPKRNGSIMPRPTPLES